jgi:hypothetical protein
LIGARRPPEPKVNAAWVERLEGAELLGDDERRVIGQHHAPRAHADRLGAGGNMADQHCRGRARNPRHVVMLGEPEAPIAPTFDVLGEIERVPESISGRRAFDDRSEIEDRERNRRVGHEVAGLSRAGR